MNLRFFFFFILLNFITIEGALQAQTLNPTNQTQLNNYLKCVNEATDYVNNMVGCLQNFFEDAERYKNEKNKDRFGSGFRHYTAYQCSKQLEEYYYKEAQKGSFANLNQNLQLFWQSLEKLDKKCKDVEIYIRLEDYKKDNLAQSDKWMAEFPSVFTEFIKAQKQLVSEVTQVYRRLQPSNLQNPYHQAEKKMLDWLTKEAQLMRTWNFNFDESVPIQWETSLIEQNVLTNAEALRNTSKSALQYPANSMVDSFMEELKSIQEMKRDAVDKYNFQAKKDGQLRNYTYKSLVNHYNGVLVSNFNTFVDFSKQQNQYLLYQPKFVIQPELNRQKAIVNVKAKPFEDKIAPSFQTTPTNQPISKDAFQALKNYTDFINEIVRTTGNMRIPLLNLHQSVQYQKGKERSYQLSYNYNDQNLSKSTYQKTLTESRFLLPKYTSSLNVQLEVLMNILIEMIDLNNELAIYISEKKNQQDDFARAEEILKRFEVLYDVLDTRKEQLYIDVRRVFETYSSSNPQSSWQVSGNVLLQIVDTQRELLFITKKYFKGDSSSIPKNENITVVQNLHRELISNEYQNMKGIERIGRNNGLCPYTPYEYIGEYTASFAEKIQKVSSYPIQQKSYGYSHPYHNYAYLYNDMVRNYNKFSELSKPIQLLPLVLQPELFILDKNNKPANVPTQKRELDEENDPEFYKTMEGYATNHLVFLLDVSASMAPADRLPLLKKSIKFLIGIMRPQDRISVVVYSGKAEIVLQNISSQETDKIKQAIDELKSDGKTNSEEGIKMAYKVASKNFIKNGNNRIILATDGEFQVGENTLNMVEKNAQEEISLSVFSFGQSDKKYTNLLKLIEKGKGNYEHITEGNANYKLLKEAKAKKLDK